MISVIEECYRVLVVLGDGVSLENVEEFTAGIEYRVRREGKLVITTLSNLEKGKYLGFAKVLIV